MKFIFTVRIIIILSVFYTLYSILSLQTVYMVWKSNLSWSEHNIGYLEKVSKRKKRFEIVIQFSSARNVQKSREIISLFW